MTHLTIQKVDKNQLKSDLPEIRPGYTVKVHQKIKEGDKQRIQIFEGLVIAIGHGHGPSRTITVRKLVAGIGVEKIFAVHSPNIAKIDVIRTGKIRRAKLYYMRDRSGKSARLKEVMVSHSTKGDKAEVPFEEGENQDDVPVVEEVLEENTAVESTAPEEAAEETKKEEAVAEDSTEEPAPDEKKE